MKDCYIAGKKELVLKWLVRFLFAALFLVVGAWSGQTFYSTENVASAVFTAVENFGLIITAFVAVLQLKDSKEISRASFIVELNQAFVNNADYKELYDALQADFDRSFNPANGRLRPLLGNLRVKKSAVSNYLTFFETIYILYKRGGVSFKILDDLFAYRFFMAIHSEYIQRQKLIPQPDNFKNIFLLERDWLAYRVKIGKHTEAELDMACNRYREYLDGKTEAAEQGWKNIYEMGQLKAIVPEETYHQLMKENGHEV